VVQDDKKNFEFQTVKMVKLCGEVGQERKNYIQEQDIQEQEQDFQKQEQKQKLRNINRISGTGSRIFFGFSIKNVDYVPILEFLFLFLFLSFYSCSRVSVSVPIPEILFLFLNFCSFS
jgi:hypothetical protein